MYFASFALLVLFGVCLVAVVSWAIASVQCYGLRRQFFRSFVQEAAPRAVGVLQGLDASVALPPEQSPSREPTIPGPFVVEPASIIKHRHIGKDAIVYVSFFRKSGRASFHLKAGRSRHQLGGCEIKSRMRDSDVVDLAVREAEAFLKTEVLCVPPAPSDSPVERDAVDVFEGILLSHGQTTFKGKDADESPTYSARILADSSEVRVAWGKGLEQAIKEACLMVGDRVRLTMLGKEPVEVVREGVPTPIGLRNRWRAEKLAG